MSDDATLKDVTVSPNPAATASTPEPAKPPVEIKEPDATVAVTDADALEIGRLLLESGVTKERVNDVLQAPQALASIRNLLQSNQEEFLNMLERSDPTAHNALLEAGADRYVKRYGKKDEAGGGKGAATPELMQEVTALREEVGQFRSRQEQAAAQAAMAQVKSRYEGRVDDMFAQLPKELGLTKAEAKALRAQLNQELAEDPSIVQRVSNGNFVDVPRRFQTIIEGWSTDKKAASEAAKAQRDRATSGASPELQGGPGQLIVDLPKGFEDSWDATEEAYAKALGQQARG